MQLVIFFRLIPFICLSLFIFSCRDGGKDKLINYLSENLAVSNRQTEANTQQVLFYLREKTTDPVAEVKAKVWYPRADSIWSLIELSKKYFEKIKKGSGDKNDIKAKTKIYLSGLLKIDEKMSREFSDGINKNQKSIDSVIELLNKENRTAISNYIQSILFNYANKMTIYCNEQINDHRGDNFYELYSSIIGLNRNNFKTDEVLELSSGIGAYSVKCNPEFYVYGVKQPLTDAGHILYKEKLKKKPGKYFIPVKITYTNQFGKQEIQEHKIQYEVTEPCH